MPNTPSPDGDYFLIISIHPGEVPKMEGVRGHSFGFESQIFISHFHHQPIISRFIPSLCGKLHQLRVRGIVFVLKVRGKDTPLFL
jgi:hypothetical protein